MTVFTTVQTDTSNIWESLLLPVRYTSCDEQGHTHTHVHMCCRGSGGEHSAPRGCAESDSLSADVFSDWWLLFLCCQISSEQSGAPCSSSLSLAPLQPPRHGHCSSRCVWTLRSPSQRGASQINERLARRLTPAWRAKCFLMRRGPSCDSQRRLARPH